MCDVMLIPGAEGNIVVQGHSVIMIPEVSTKKLLFGLAAILFLVSEMHLEAVKL